MKSHSDRQQHRYLLHNLIILVKCISLHVHRVFLSYSLEHPNGLLSVRLDWGSKKHSPLSFDEFFSFGLCYLAGIQKSSKGTQILPIVYPPVLL
jgi:hypothetical protein